MTTAQASLLAGHDTDGPRSMVSSGSREGKGTSVEPYTAAITPTKPAEFHGTKPTQVAPKLVEASASHTKLPDGDYLTTPREIEAPERTAILKQQPSSRVKVSPCPTTSFQPNSEKDYVLSNLWQSHTLCVHEKGVSALLPARHTSNFI